MKRHILNFTHSGAQFRLYANYCGVKDGDSELKELMKLVETELGPKAETPTVFINSVKDEMRNRGFELFKA